jgi:uncharacterized protein
VTVATVSGLFVYPVKSARGLAMDRAVVEATGLAEDRRYMVVRPDGRFITQRSHPVLATLRTRLEPAGLALSADGCAWVGVVPGDGVRPIDVEVWGDRVAARDCGDSAAELLSELLDEPARLAWIPPASWRAADPDFTGSIEVPVGFADGFPILVCNEASLADLNGRLPSAIPMNRFRPNVVLSGLPAYAEDGISDIAIGALRLRFVKPCTRCTMPAIDQVTGERGVDPSPVLKQYRHDPVLRGVTFGVNAIVLEGGGQTIRVGDRVESA